MNRNFGRHLAGILGIAVLCSPLAAIGAQSEYTCTVTEYRSLEAKGTLVVPLSPLHIASVFNVSRSTGKVVGDPFWAPNLSQGVVYDHGGPAQSFKAVSLVPDSAGRVAYIAIREFAAGKEKPFVAIVDTSVYSGVCK